MADERSSSSMESSMNDWASGSQSKFSTNNSFTTILLIVDDALFDEYYVD